MSNTDNGNDISVAVVFPLPFQILALVGLEILGWATNLHGLDVTGIDAVTSLDLRTDLVTGPLSAHLPTHRHKSSLVALYSSMYRIFVSYSAICFASWLAWRYTTRGDVGLVDVFGYIPALACLTIVTILLCPYNILHKTERRKFLHAIKRCLVSPWGSPVYFGDVILADIFTSFAQVVGDIWLSLCMLIPGHSMLRPQIGVGMSRWILPTVMSLPYLVRLRQCIIEYSHQGNMHRRPLYNALKYASAFPAIYLSAALGSVSTDMASDDKPLSIFASTNTIFRLWLLAATINSLYSFWWDVTNDWGMDLFKMRDDDEQVARSSSRPRRLLLPRLHSGTPLVSRSSSSIDLQEAASIRTLSETTNHKRYYHPYGLRSLLHFPLTVYPFVILLNLVLRLTWSMKLFSVVNVNSHAGMANFCLKVAELFRRWMWVFVRVEWEMIKKGQEGHTKVRTDESSAYEMVSPGSAEPH